MAGVKYANLDNMYKSNIANAYVKPPVRVSAYGYRGMTDFSNIGQFTQYETGYGQIYLLKAPVFMDRLADLNDNVKIISDQFKNIMEYEFKGIEGLPDISSEAASITNGIQTIEMINKVTKESAITVSMDYYERTGMPLTKYSELFLTGIKDPVTEYKTYHGLIACGEVEPGYQNEVFTLLYINTDNTGTEVESSVLLANAQLTNCKKSIINSTRGEISNQTVTLEFKCYPISNEKTDEMAAKMLRATTGIKVTHASKGTTHSVDASAKLRSNSGKKVGQDETVDTILNSQSYNYNVFSKNTKYGSNINIDVTKRTANKTTL